MFQKERGWKARGGEKCDPQQNDGIYPFQLDKSKEF